MAKAWGWGILSIGLCVSAAGAPLEAKAPGIKAGRATGATRVAAPLLTAAVDPHFGTQDSRITVVSASQFQAFWSGGLDSSTPWDFATMSRVCTDCGSVEGVHYLANLDIPAGAIIDFIGVNTSTDTDAVMGFSLLFRDHLGGFANLASFSFPAHSFGTDYAGPLGILVPGNKDRSFVLDAEQAISANPQYFGYVEIWWRLAVSDPPATPTFGDVPPSHPFYQFIEALAKSGITGGCGGSNYCPDAPLTRGQMAVFLSKALGLHWSN